MLILCYYYCWRVYLVLIWYCTDKFFLKLVCCLVDAWRRKRGVRDKEQTCSLLSLHCIFLDDRKKESVQDPVSQAGNSTDSMGTVQGGWM